jgi:hypothetical protein
VIDLVDWLWVNHVSVVITWLITCLFLSRCVYIMGERCRRQYIIFWLLVSKRNTTFVFPTHCRCAIGVGRTRSPKPTSPHVPVWGRCRINFLGSTVVTTHCSNASSMPMPWFSSICIIYSCVVLVPTTPMWEFPYSIVYSHITNTRFWIASELCIYETWCCSSYYCQNYFVRH